MLFTYKLDSFTEDAVASINRCRKSLHSLYIFFSTLVNVLYQVTVNEVYGNSLLDVFKIYGFCKGDEGL